VSLGIILKKNKKKVCGIKKRVYICTRLRRETDDDRVG